MVSFETTDEVNKKLTVEKQFDPLGWYFAKTQRLHSDYRRLYPNGGLLRKFRLYTALAFGALCPGSFTG